MVLSSVGLWGLVAIFTEPVRLARTISPGEAEAGASRTKGMVRRVGWPLTQARRSTPESLSTW